MVRFFNALMRDPVNSCHASSVSSSDVRPVDLFFTISAKQSKKLCHCYKTNIYTSYSHWNGIYTAWPNFAKNNSERKSTKGYLWMPTFTMTITDKGTSVWIRIGSLQRSIAVNPSVGKLRTQSHRPTPLSALNRHEAHTEHVAAKGGTKGERKRERDTCCDYVIP